MITRRTSAPVVMLLLLCSLSTPQSAAGSHTAQCAAQQQYGFAGEKKASTQGKRIDGVRAELEAQGIDLCTGTTPPGGRNSWVWIDIEGTCGTTGNCIMQLGLGRAEPTQTMGWWWAWGRDPLAPGCAGYTNVSPGAQRISDWNGQQVRYEINRVLSSTISLWVFIIDGVEKRSLAESQICWPNIYAAWFGEAVNRGSAIGGFPLNHFDVTANRYRVQADSTWYTPAWSVGNLCSIENPKPPYHCRKMATDALEMWTDHP